MIFKEDSRDVDQIASQASEKGFEIFYCSNYSFGMWKYAEKMIKVITEKIKVGFYEGEIELCSRIVKYQED